MQRLWRVAALAAILNLVLSGADWPTQSGGPQRDAWARAEKIITKENVGSLELLYKYKTDNQAIGLNSLSTPIIAGNLITYRGFKEMLVFAGSADNVYSVDADLNRLLWKRHFDTAGAASAAGAAVCPGGLTTSVAMSGSSSAGFRGSAPAKPAAPAKPVTKEDAEKAAKAKADKEKKDAGKPPSPKAQLAPGFGHLGGMFTVSSDGFLHTLNSSTGGDLLPPVKFLPPHSNVSSLNVVNNVVFAATSDRCGGKPNALYAVDVTSKKMKVARFAVNGSEISGIGATAIGMDGTVYVQVTPGKEGKAAPYVDCVVALTPELEVKGYFRLSGLPPAQSEQGGITPTLFTWKEKEMVVAGGRDGRIYLLDAASLGGPDHKTPLFQTEPVTVSGKGPHTGLRGAFATWYDADSETRWIYAPVWGSIGSSVQFGMTNGDVSSGGLAAFQLIDEKGRPTLKPAWTSKDLTSPAPPAVANGMVFVLSNGDAGTPAVLYALDGTTGKELYSSGAMAATFSHPGGVAVANGRVYFTTHDDTVYCLGFSKLNPQLTDR